MDGFEEKLGAILSNPEMMNTIAAMAQSLGAQPPAQSPPPPSAPSPGGGLPIGPGELELVQKIAGFARQTGLDTKQQDLLHALTPYLSHGRLQKLEKAMHAAKIAQFASKTLHLTGLESIFGR